MHGRSSCHRGTNQPIKTDKSSRSSTKSVKVDRRRRIHVSEGDLLPRQSADKNTLWNEQYSDLNLPASREVIRHHDLTNVRTSEQGMRYNDSSNKSLADGRHSHQQDINIPTVEQQLEDLMPSKELLEHYREKIVLLNNDYQDLMPRVDQCQALCDLSFQLEQDLAHRNSEVSKLQKTVSDLQVYVHQEREEVLRLYTENDRLQVRAAEDRKTISFLLSLNHMTEHDVAYLSSNAQHIAVPRVYKSKSFHRVRNSNEKYKQDIRDNSADGGVQLHSEEARIETNALCAELEERAKIHRDQVQSLIKDREISWKERNLEQRRVQDHISVLSNSLKKTQAQLCDVTKELVNVKKDGGNKELGWAIEKNKLLQNLEFCQEKLGEKYPPVSGFAVSGSGSSLNSSKQLCAQVVSLKDQLKQRDSLVSMYQEQCKQLNEETAKYREQADISKKRFREQTQKLAGQVTYLKNKYNDIDRRRKLEAEGFCNDIKILRGRLQNLEKNVKKLCLKQAPSQTPYPTNNDLLLTAKEARTQSQQLERELRGIKKKMEEIESGIGEIV